MNAEKKHLHWILGEKKKNNKIKAQYVSTSPQTLICIKITFHQQIPILCKPGTSLQRYVLLRHVLQQPPEEHLNLTFLVSAWESEVNRQR